MLTRSDKVAIFGQGVLGKQIAQLMGKDNRLVITRSKSHFSDFIVTNYDLKEIETIVYKMKSLNVKYAVLAFAVNGIQRCKLNQIESRLINVEQSLNLVEILAEAGIQSLVFSSSLIWDLEDTIQIGDSTNFDLKPRTEYGKQKRELENGILKNSMPATIVRLGKVITDNFLYQRINSQNGINNNQIRCYTNLVSAPIHINSLETFFLAWIRGEISESVINMVPSNQIIDCDLIEHILSQYYPHLSTKKVELNLPQDELPKRVFCPNAAEVYPEGIYGFEAVELAFKIQ